LNYPPPKRLTNRSFLTVYKSGPESFLTNRSGCDPYIGPSVPCRPLPRNRLRRLRPSAAMLHPILKPYVVIDIWCDSRLSGQRLGSA